VAALTGLENFFVDPSEEGKCVPLLVFKAHRLCASLNSRLESNTEEEYMPLKNKRGCLSQVAALTGLENLFVDPAEEGKCVAGAQVIVAQRYLRPIDFYITQL